MPKIGDYKDGKYWTGPKYGWQSPETIKSKKGAAESIWRSKPGQLNKPLTLPGLGTKVYTGPNYGYQFQTTVDKQQGKSTAPASAPAPKQAPDPAPAPAPAPEPAPAPAPAPSGGNGGNGSTGSTVSAARKAELKAINSDPTLSNLEKWKRANPRLSDARDIRARFKSAGISPYSKQARRDVSRVLYNPGTRAYYGESYDIVLDYLLSEGHADTVEEAHYIMLQLDSEYIQSIVENVQGGPILPGEKGKKVYPKGKEPKPTGAELPKV